MRLPNQSVSVNRTNSSFADIKDNASAMIMPSAGFLCKADYTATRTKKKCWKTPFGKKCINIPEFKEGQWHGNGDSCESCFASGRHSATSAGGWSIKSEWGRECNPI